MNILMLIPILKWDAYPYFASKSTFTCTSEKNYTVVVMGIYGA